MKKKEQRTKKVDKGEDRGLTSEDAVSGEDYVDYDLGLDDKAIKLDSKTWRKRRGKHRKGKPVGRYQMVVHKDEKGLTQISVLEGRNLVEHFVDHYSKDTDNYIDGNIYWGQVQNVLPGMEAAFVNIGTHKNAVIYRSDVLGSSEPINGRDPKIEDLLKKGQFILVQVIKNPISSKGARVTQEISLAGRHIVMLPGQPNVMGISKRLKDNETKRFKKIIDSLKPEDAGTIVRTAATGSTDEEIERDLKRLQHHWEQIQELIASKNEPGLALKEPSLVLRILREEFSQDFRTLIIDDKELFDEAKSYISALAPALADRVKFYRNKEIHVAEKYHITEQLVKSLSRSVWLPSGGSIVIERTEALTVVDINTAKNVGNNNLEETVFETNCEAAESIAKELRLRDIGGIIVIDFIDMDYKQNQEIVVRKLKDALAREKTRTQVFPISELGLVQMTRKRIGEGLVESLSDICKSCDGRGYVVSNKDFI